MSEAPKTILHVDAGKPLQANIAAAAVRGAPRLKGTFEEVLAVQNTFEKFPELRGLANNKERRTWLAERMREFRLEADEEQRKLAELEKRGASLKWQREIVNDISEWAEAGIELERCTAPMFKTMRKAVNDGKSFYLSKDIDAITPSGEFEKEVFRFAEVLLVEHDWGAAFASADLKDVTVRLPYDVCAFEFVFSGRPVIALATQFEDDVAFAPVISSESGWAVPDFVVPLSGYTFDSADEGMLRLFTHIASQITAICIALDAEVARSDVIREPYRAGRVNSNAFMIPKGYHVVSLANRGPRPLAGSSTPSGRHVRMHFRRGHWRHFEDHKTWIKWILVGDPDLGFVEKHYRL